MVFKNVKYIVLINLTHFFFLFIFLSQKMDHKVISKKTEITKIVKKFKETLDLHSDKVTERDLKFSKNVLKLMKI